MGKLLIALITITVIGIIVATASSYVAPSLLEMPPGTDEPGSMDMEYICFYPDGLSMEIIEGPDVADQIPPLC